MTFQYNFTVSTSIVLLPDGHYQEGNQQPRFVWKKAIETLCVCVVINTGHRHQCT